MSTTVHYTNGFGRKIAAEKAGITVNKLGRELFRKHIPSHHYNKALTPEQINVIQCQHAMGMTYKQLSDKYGMSISSMHRYCQL